MQSTYINKETRSKLINQYLDCWFDTESYSKESEAESEAALIKSQLEALNNSELLKEIKSTGWEFIYT